MITYRVSWTAPIEAGSPEEAVRLARAILADPEHEYTLWDVCDDETGEFIEQVDTRRES